MSSYSRLWAVALVAALLSLRSASAAIAGSSPGLPSDYISTSSSPGRYATTITGPNASPPGALDQSAATPSISAGALAALLPSTADSAPEVPPRKPYTAPPPLGARTTQSGTGAGPDSPLIVDGQTRTLASGQQHWYAFKHVGPDSQANGTTITILLNVNPVGSATFNVWTPGEVQALAAGDTTNGVPVGSGSLHPSGDDSSVDRFGGSPEWAGKLRETGTYYVQVIQTGSAPSSYSLQVSHGSKAK